jgi:hypothetical protein
MFSRLPIKRFCHTHSRSKCYENIHKLNSLKQDVNELKEIIKELHEPLRIIYCSSVVTLITVPVILFLK